MIAVAITEQTTDRALAAIDKALAVADLAEVRLDLMDEFDLTRLAGYHPKRTIVTARAKREGGKWRGSEAARTRTLDAAIKAGVAYIDVELDSVHAITERSGTKVIVSFHDFEKTPDDLPSIVMRMATSGADVVKVVCMANDQGDNLKLLSLLEKPYIPTIALAMGERGVPSRVLAGKLGGFLTFTSLGADRGSAPGQPTVGDLLDLYRYRSLSPETAVYGVIANPVAHSASPTIMNRAFAALDIDAVYLPFLVDDVASFVRDFQKLDVRGYSVTVPHKQGVMDVVDDIEPLAAKVGAVNTLVRRADRWYGANTDLQAAVSSIERACAEVGAALSDARALVLGAGGAARAVACGLVDSGASVTIANRTFEKAQALAAEVGADCVRLSEASTVECDIVANTTSVGMHPHVDATPIGASAFHEGQVVFDAVYNPAETRLIREAAAAGARVVTGIDMFIEQAAAQFALWTGREAPRETMRRALTEHLDRQAGR